MRPGEGYTNFVPANPGNHCNFRPTTGVNALYTAERSYSGADTVVLVIIFPTREERQFAYYLNVRSVTRGLWGLSDGL